MHTLKPRPATPRGWSGGSTAIYFFAGGGRFGASADIGANRSERKKPKMTNAAPRIFLQEGRKPDLRCALHKGLLCGTNLPFFAFTAMTALESFDSKIFLKRTRRLGR
jgi:hypothetical protein